MPRSFLLCIALMGSSGCAPPPPAPPAVIEAGRVGGVAVGDTVQALEAAYAEDRRRAVDLRLEGMPAPALELMPQGAQRPDALVAELIEQDGVQRVYRIQVRDSAIETRRGVGVGDTVGDLRASHPPDRLIGGEGNVGLRVEALAATFLLDGDRVQPEWRRTNDPDAVPDDVTIRRILLTCPLPSCAPSNGTSAESSPATGGENL